jgi:hypothetical protein
VYTETTTKTSKEGVLDYSASAWGTVASSCDEGNKTFLDVLLLLDCSENCKYRKLHSPVRIYSTTHNRSLSFSDTGGRGNKFCMVHSYVQFSIPRCSCQIGTCNRNGHTCRLDTQYTQSAEKSCMRASGLQMELSLVRPHHTNRRFCFGKHLKTHRWVLPRPLLPFLRNTRSLFDEYTIVCNATTYQMSKTLKLYWQVTQEYSKREVFGYRRWGAEEICLWPSWLDCTVASTNSSGSGLSNSMQQSPA